MYIQAQTITPNQFNHNFPVEEVLQENLLTEIMEKVGDLLRPYVKMTEEPLPDGTKLKATLQYDVQKRMVADKDEYGFTMVPKVVISFYEPLNKNK